MVTGATHGIVKGDAVELTKSGDRQSCSDGWAELLWIVLRPTKENVADALHNNVALRRRVGPTDQRSLRDFRFPPDRYQIAALRQMAWRTKGGHTDGRGHLHCELNSRRSLVLGPRYHEIHEYWQAAVVVRDARECAELSLFAGASRLGRGARGSAGARIKPSVR